MTNRHYAGVYNEYGVRKMRTPAWYHRFNWQKVSDKATGETMLVALGTITPEMATEMLVLSTNYRISDRHRIIKYASVMANNAWEINADTLKYDDGGLNIDGQHRLAGCIESKTPFTSLMAYGVKSVSETDRGKARRLSDALTHRGCSNAVTLAAALAVVYAYQNSKVILIRGYGSYPTCSEAFSTLDDNPDLVHYITIANRLKQLFPTSLGSPLLYLGCHELHTGISKAEQFIDGVSHGVEGNFSDARHVLRCRLEANQRSKAKLNKTDLAAIWIKSWNRYCLGLSTTPANIRWRNSGEQAEEFPEFIKATDL
jgi:hypothetical protein